MHIHIFLPVRIYMYIYIYIYIYIYCRMVNLVLLVQMARKGLMAALVLVVRVVVRVHMAHWDQWARAVRRDSGASLACLPVPGGRQS